MTETLIIRVIDKMKLPKKIKIAGHYYDIIFPYKFQDRTDLFAQTDNARLTIKISEIDGNGHKLPDSSIRETFIHEVLHAINYNYNSNIAKHGTITRMAIGIHQVISDNFSFGRLEK